VAAGVLGTLKLLLKCRDADRTLPKLSPRLGADVRTNSEALIGMTTRDRTQDLSKGIAIDAGFYPDENTHIETVRYPAGSSFMRLLAVPMVSEGSWLTRPLKLIGSFFVHPIDSLKLIFNFRWAESTVILLVMQNIDNRLRVFLKRSWYTLFRPHLSTRREEGVPPVPVFIPIANQVAKLLGKKMDGIPQSALNEVLLQTPTTAHILGGCAIGKDRETGVIDMNQQAFDYPELYICDGSAIPANLGVNPSLTITAMTELAMSRVRAKRV
jgi:cholesterol oxidase